MTERLMRCTRSPCQPALIPMVAMSLFCASASGCNQTPPIPAPSMSEAMQALLTDTTAHLLTIGYADHDPMQVVASTGRSSVSPGGTHVAILGDRAPLVRIFDRAGNLHAGFLESGRGPGEAQNPLGIAVSDSEVLILDAGWRVLLFDLDGTLKAEVASERFVSSIMNDGAAGWIAYGPEGEGAEVAWLRSIQVGTTGLTWGDPLFHASRRRDQWVGAGTGVPNVITWPDHMLLYHHWATPPEVVLVSDGRSGQGVQEVIKYANRALPSLQPSGTGGGEVVGDRGVAYTLPANPVAAGAVWLADGLLWAETLFVPGEQWTDIWFVTPERAYRVRVDGAFRFRGRTAQGDVLVTSSEPVPHAFLIEGNRLHELLVASSYEPI